MALIQHHPRNGYLIKLDSEAPMEGNIQKLCLCLFVQVAALADDRGKVTVLLMTEMETADRSEWMNI